MARALQAYRSKRDFTSSPEPHGDQLGGRGSAATAAHGRRFVVQRHRARREHFDLRLEMDGVMLSWAVTKGPSADPRTKRLAVRTEDHPISYADFEGVIPDKSYGAGPVMIWDQGSWAAVGAEPATALGGGHLKFVLSGKRIRGRWALVRLKSAGARENWLLIKDRDTYAEGDDSLAQRFDTSVVTNRTFAHILQGKKGQLQKRRNPPDFVPPMLCIEAGSPPSGDDWQYEIKYDGYRLQMAVGENRVVLRTRNGHDWTAKFPDIANAAQLLSTRIAVLDGEAVVLGRDGLADYPKLVSAIKQGGAGVQFVAFDLLRVDDRDLTKLPLAERRAALQELLGNRGTDAIRIAPAVRDGGQELLARVTVAGGEGIIAKRVSSKYYSRRSSSWLKIKAVRRDDAVVVGWLPSRAGRHFASLVLAHRDSVGLRYVGRVGTGFTARVEREVFEQLSRHGRKSAPRGISGLEAAPDNTQWVTPRFTAAISHGGTTADGRWRAARFLGWRDDVAGSGTTSARPDAKPVDHFAKSSVTLTHVDRVVFSDVGLTKADIAAYYQRVAPRILPHLQDRPVSLLRAPNGIDHETFFQRHPMPAMRRGIRRIPSPDEMRAEYMSINEADGLATAVQFGAVEFHGWGATCPDLDAPDRMIFDLDPADDVPFAAVRRAADLIRRVLERAALKSYALVSGGKGIHVVVPLDRTQSWTDIEASASAIARTLARAEADRFVATASKARRKGRIYIDWLRNKRSGTAIVPYSLRARPSASVAMPVSWRTLAGVQSASQFTVADTATAGGSPWRGFFDVRQHVTSNVMTVLRQFGG